MIRWLIVQEVFLIQRAAGHPFKKNPTLFIPVFIKQGANIIEKFSQSEFRCLCTYVVLNSLLFSTFFPNDSHSSREMQVSSVNGGRSDLTKDEPFKRSVGFLGALLSVLLSWNIQAGSTETVKFLIFFSLTLSPVGRGVPIMGRVLPLSN